MALNELIKLSFGFLIYKRGGNTNSRRSLKRIRNNKYEKHIVGIQ